MKENAGRILRTPTIKNGITQFSILFSAKVLDLKQTMLKLPGIPNDVRDSNLWGNDAGNENMIDQSYFLKKGNYLN